MALSILLKPRSPDREPVWPSGRAVGWKAEGPRFESASALLSLQRLWLWTQLVTLSLTINETLKWLSSLPTLCRSHSGGDSVAVGI